MFDPELPCRAYVRHVYADRDDPQCRGRYFLVVFHPDPDDMRRAAYRHDKSSAYRTHRPGSVDDALGLWQPASARARYDRKQRMWVDTTPPFAGVMRFARGHLTPDVIAHESTHAALHITRLHDWSKDGHDGRADFGDDCDLAEEAFAYLLGDIVQSVTALVEQLGAWREHGA
ncbi:MAG: hypothetical protein IPG16_03335 [Comamonadaceae bacterium]|nr:hypothetical protein [Comamonadaceae bacterium]